jgi:hypothetical protein
MKDEQYRRGGVAFDHSSEPRPRYITHLSAIWLSGKGLHILVLGVVRVIIAGWGIRCTVHAMDNKIVAGSNQDRFGCLSDKKSSIVSPSAANGRRVNEKRK